MAGEVDGDGQPGPGAGDGFDQDVDRYNVESYVMGISGADPVRGLTDYDPDGRPDVTKNSEIKSFANTPLFNK